MSENFKRGDIAIAQYFEQFPEYNGMECEVIDPLEFRGLINADMTVREHVLRYRVQFADGMMLGPLPHQLRKRPVPDEKYAANDSAYLEDMKVA